MFNCANLQKKSTGFTIVELLIVISILGIVGSIVFSSFYAYQSHSALTYASAKVKGLLEEARNFTLSSKSDTQYGVQFESDRAIFFEGNSYSAGATNNRTVIYGRGVTLHALSLNGGGDSVVFDRLTGETSEYGTVTLAIVSSSTAVTTIRIHKTGLIEKQ